MCVCVVNDRILENFQDPGNSQISGFRNQGLFVGGPWFRWFETPVGGKYVACQTNSAIVRIASSDYFTALHLPRHCQDS